MKIPFDNRVKCHYDGVDFEIERRNHPDFGDVFLTFNKLWGHEIEVFLKVDENYVLNNFNPILDNA